MKIYLSGPMTGLPNNNYPAFNEAARKLRAKGYRVLNPAEIEPPEIPTWKNYMRECIKMLMSANAVAMLPGWSQSRGASIEVDLALNLGMPAVCADELNGVSA